MFELRLKPWQKQYSSYNQLNARSARFNKSSKIKSSRIPRTSWENEAANDVIILILTSVTPPTLAAFSHFRIRWTASRIIIFLVDSDNGLVTSESFNVCPFLPLRWVNPVGVSLTFARSSSSPRLGILVAPISSSSCAPSASLRWRCSSANLTPGPSPTLVSWAASSLDTWRT
jgi:hypothetical protein